MKQIKLNNGELVSALGQGTWHMGENSAEFNREVAALRLGLDLGMNLIDTAELYADAELVVAEAIKGRRADAFIVSKVLPSNASYQGTITACERSLKRLQIECLDMYLLHWPGLTPVEETLEVFQTLVEAGKIRHYGVSNFDYYETQLACQQPGGKAIATNQLLYNLNKRGIEWDLLPWCRKQGVPVMAYSPLDEGRLQHPVLNIIAQRHQATAAQVALAWLLQQDSVIAIPKAVKPEHIKQNAAAAELVLSAQDLHEIEQAFPAPTQAQPLHVY
ncbi:aldo/keto reductase [Dasania sp. GY-MA-18]|uniref:Aldo/keto reductase n=1 Tax=Dasania phycosphaerae TaxID=2950436 RepID=A0A9J6RKC7_9GAMM|nr:MULTISPECIES: aldo/keto reductase [Dasania]MCR8922252.1 aldo/keto reductase [Dasania sp. GY-MA-18]MCZ0864680.1 aldo/keto reductase [Dasania phycosphaerae]MCZ0868408.1 aldo/keto reductase [Dasania phycosphaerae]